MTIDMTGWQRLSATGRDKMLSQLPRGGAPVGMQFALKIKKTGWNDGQYILDLTVRTLDLSLVLSAPTWKLWPSMLPDEMVDAIDMDMYHDIWWLLETEENPKSKSARTKFHLLDTQEGIGMQESGPHKPTAANMQEVGSPSPIPRMGEQPSSSELGQPGAGGEPASQQEPPVTMPPHGVACMCEECKAWAEAQPPAAPCPHEHAHIRKSNVEPFEPVGFYCDNCGERVG